MPFPEGHKTLSQLHAEENVQRSKEKKAAIWRKELDAVAAKKAAENTISRRREEANKPQFLDPDVARVLKRLDDPDAEFITSSPE